MLALPTRGFRAEVGFEHRTWCQETPPLPSPHHLSHRLTGSGPDRSPESDPTSCGRAQTAAMAGGLRRRGPAPSACVSPPGPLTTPTCSALRLRAGRRSTLAVLVLGSREVQCSPAPVFWGARLGGSRLRVGGWGAVDNSRQVTSC